MHRSLAFEDIFNTATRDTNRLIPPRPDRFSEEKKKKLQQKQRQPLMNFPERTLSAVTEISREVTPSEETTSDGLFRCAGPASASLTG